MARTLVSSVPAALVDKALPLPALTTVQRDAIATPHVGETIFNTTTKALNAYDGATWVESKGLQIYNAVVGSLAQVSANQATHSSIASALSSYPTGRILLLAGTYAENVTLGSSNVNAVIEGSGRSSVIGGTLTLDSGAVGCDIKSLKITGAITLSLGADNNYLRECWQSTGQTITDLGANNAVLLLQE